MLALIMIAVYLHLKARPSSQYFMLAAIIGCVSLFCRAIDRAVCPQFPFGTHCLWHMLNATLLYILLKQIIRNVKPRGAPQAHGGGFERDMSTLTYLDGYCERAGDPPASGASRRTCSPTGSSSSPRSSPREFC